MSKKLEEVPPDELERPHALCRDLCLILCSPKQTRIGNGASSSTFLVRSQSSGREGRWWLDLGEGHCFCDKKLPRPLQTALPTGSPQSFC